MWLNRLWTSVTATVPWPTDAYHEGYKLPVWRAPAVLNGNGRQPAGSTVTTIIGSIERMPDRPVGVSNVITNEETDRRHRNVKP